MGEMGAGEEEGKREGVDKFPLECASVTGGHKVPRGTGPSFSEAPRPLLSLAQVDRGSRDGRTLQLLLSYYVSAIAYPPGQWEVPNPQMEPKSLCSLPGLQFPS